MKKLTFLHMIFAGLLLTGCNGEEDSKKEEKQQEQMDSEVNKKDVSYALGYNFGDVLAKTDETLRMEDVIKGMKDAFSHSSDSRMTEDEIKNTLMMYNLELTKAMQEKQEKLKNENLQKGETFITGYAKKPGVKKDGSGFLYKVVKEGKGPVPTQADTVLVEYTGKKIDGEVFFSTDSQGEPAKFNIAHVIKGWQEALQKMPVGSTWEIVFPPELAYGDRGAAEVIHPGETIIFEMTLKEILKDEKNR